jgi:hypothetical protein
MVSFIIGKYGTKMKLVGVIRPLRKVLLAGIVGVSMITVGPAEIKTCNLSYEESIRIGQGNNVRDSQKCYLSIYQIKTVV